MQPSLQNESGIQNTSTVELQEFLGKADQLNQLVSLVDIAQLKREAFSLECIANRRIQRGGGDEEAQIIQDAWSPISTALQAVADAAIPFRRYNSNILADTIPCSQAIERLADKFSALSELAYPLRLWQVPALIVLVVDACRDLSSQNILTK